jgi:hypothetical protein
MGVLVKLRDPEPKGLNQTRQEMKQAFTAVSWGVHDVKTPASTT